MKEISGRALFRIALTVFVLFLAIHYWAGIAQFLGMLLGACAPLLLGLCLAYPLNLLMRFYERHFFPRSRRKGLSRVRPGLCLLFAFLTLLGALVFVWLLVIPQLSRCLQLLLTQVPAAAKAAVQYLAEQGILTPERVQGIAEWAASFDWQSRLMDILSFSAAGATSVLSSLLGAAASVLSGFVSAFFAATFAVFVLLNKRKLADQGQRLMRRYLREPVRERLLYVLRTLDDCFHRFIVGQCAEAAVLGTLCALGMLLLGLPYPLMIGALTAFTALIPVVGAYLGAGVGALLIVMESPVQALVFLVFIVVLQQIEGNLIYPHVVGSSIQLPGIWVFAAVTVGGSLFGIPGMLIGVPLAACAYRLLRNDVNKGAPAAKS